MAYASVNGLELYYETHGSGRPLVLLHGGLMSIDLSFGGLLEPLDQPVDVLHQRIPSKMPAGSGIPSPE